MLADVRPRSQLVRRFESRSDFLRALVVAPCGRFFAAACADHTVLTWPVDLSEVPGALAELIPFREPARTC